MSPPAWLSQRAALGAFLVAGLVPAPAHAQPADEEQPEGGSGETEVEALRRELESQRRELESQRQELESQRAALEASQEEAQLQALVAEAESDQEGAGGAEAGAEGEGEGDGEGDGETDMDVGESRFRIYGFMDMGLQRTWGDQVSTTTAGTDETTFVLGNVNLYFDAEPVRDWRALTEVRLTFFPLGHETSIGSPLTPYERVDTTVVDVTSGGGGIDYVRYGSIILERAHIDWTAADWLTVRAGYFFTPFGIWNVDHGTPTLVSLTFPAFIVAEMWPLQQLGVETFGAFHSPPWSYGYHLYVSNGRTPTQVDFTDDKLVGGRLFVRTTRPFRMTLGASGFAGSVEDVEKNVPDPSELAATRDVVYAYDEQGLAADLSLELGRLRVHTEVVMRQVFYEEGLRETRLSFGPGADRREWGAYLMGAYRFSWAGLEPFGRVDFLRLQTPIGEALLLPSVGLNIHFNSAAQLKLQYTRVWFFDIKDLGHDHSDQRLHFLAARLVIAY